MITSHWIFACFFPKREVENLWSWCCGAPLWRDQRDWINLLVWNAWKCPGLLLNGRVGRTTGRQMFKQCVHSPLVRRGPPCLAAFKADTVGWRLGASCATKLLCRASVGQTGGRFYTSKPRRQREEMERRGWCQLHSIVLTTGTTEDRVWWLRNWTFNILTFCRLVSGCCPPLTQVKCVWMAVSVVHLTTAQLTQCDSA